MLNVKRLVIVCLLIAPSLSAIVNYNNNVNTLTKSNSSHVLRISIHNHKRHGKRIVNNSEEDNRQDDLNKKDDTSYITTNIAETGRCGGGGGKKGGFLQKVLPFMVIPFLISSSIMPIALTALKFMLMKSAFIGKIAIILLVINMFFRSNNQGGVYSHNIDLSPLEKTPFQKEVSMVHYGYNGDEEYGAYIHSR